MPNVQMIKYTTFGTDYNPKTARKYRTRDVVDAVLFAVKFDGRVATDGDFYIIHIN